jgi:hypothetical protein
MNFLAPAAFAFAAALPVVIVFYLLKRKRTVKLISSTLLWQKFLAESQASAPFQRLRHNWLLVLQLLLLLLAVLALARPYFAGKMSGGNLFVAILDASASMQSTDETPSRFEKARAEALKLVGSLQDTDQMVVLLAAGTTEVKQSPTSDKSALRRAIETCVVTDSPTRLAEALKLAESSIRSHPSAEIHLFSDGATPDLTEFENKGLRLVFHGVGQRADNLGIVTLDVRANPENAAQRALFASIGNYSSNAQPTELELRFNGNVIDTRPLTLKPRETSPQVFVAAQPGDGIFSLHLTAKDDLTADNQASVVSQLPKPVKVLLVSKGNQWLAKALRAAPSVELIVAQDLADNGRAFDIVVLDNVIPAIWPAVNTLAIRVAQTNWFDDLSLSASPVIVGLKSTHPLLRFASLDNVQIKESLEVRTPNWATAIAESAQKTLIAAGEFQRRRIVWIGFDTLDSNWPLRVSFPIFIANAVEWLNPAAANAAQFSVRAGEPFRLNLVDPVAAAEVTLPDGSVRRLKLDADAREIVFGDTMKQGIYKLRAGTNATTFCVNVLDAAESDTTPRAEIQFGKYAKVKSTTQSRANMEIWRWFSLFALAVLLFEWWWYHKRTA